MVHLPSGSILAVTMTDPHATGKNNRFVGICIQRGGRGLGATFVLRNIIDNQGKDIVYLLAQNYYQMLSPSNKEELGNTTTRSQSPNYS